MHNKQRMSYKQLDIQENTIQIFIFISSVGRLLLDPSASSFSSFITSSFLIQMLRWIRGSSRVESLYSSSLEGSSLDRESLIFSCFHFLFSYYESSFFVCAHFPESVEGNHFLLADIPQMNESHDLGRPFKIYYSSSISLSQHQTLPFGVFKGDT